MNAPGLNFTGIHARSPETTATRRHDLGPLADRRRGTPLASLCTVAEQQEAAAFAAPRRRLEYLAWHALLHALLPEAHAAHDPEGGPY